MDKKTLPIVALLVLVIVFYYPILEFLGLYEEPEKLPPRQQTEQQTEQPIDTATPQPFTQEDIENVSEPPTGKAGIDQPQAAEIPDTVSADTIRIETNVFTYLFSSHGGGPVSIKLKDYHYRENGEIEMLPESETATPDARFAGGTFSTSRLPYSSSKRSGDYDVIRDTFELAYTYTSESGGTIRKTYIIYPDDYHYDLTLDVENTDAFGFERSYTLWWNTPLGVTESVAETDYNSMQAVAMMGGSREALDDYSNDKLSQSLDGYTEWVGLRSKFFSAAMIPRNRDGQAAVARGMKQDISTPDGTIEKREIIAGVVMPFAGVQSVTDSFTVYVGPMDYLEMDNYGVDLQAILDIGTFPFFGTVLLKPFAIAIMWLLPKLHNIIPNYGIVIIIFALLIKIITLPLSMKQFKSMQGMKDLAPRMEELKKKYKKDPQALQRETMKMYKQHGVNPMSGCLVMLPQMPVMIAMFRVFQATILLRAEPFVWFIDDLSRGASGFTDPYIILVLFMVLTQLLSSKLTMSGGAGQNKAMIYLFPLLIGFFLYQLPSGLILYWTVFSLMSLLDWFLFKRDKVKNLEVKTA